MSKPRVYGKWAGNPQGQPEDKTRCVASVYRRYSVIPGQCVRKRGYGPNGVYCKQHAAAAGHDTAPAPNPE
jgi:hypothetical protein